MARSTIMLLLLVGGTAVAQTPTPTCVATPGRHAEQLRGQITSGEAFSEVTPAGWVLRLLPVPEGWLLQITTQDRAKEDLSRLTPPLHITPNPRQIEGWHFRNAENTGPNDGSVNAPQELREFIFSPRVGRDIQDSDARSSVTAAEVDEVRSFGRGWLFIESYRLTPARAGERARFESLRFSACLTWPG